MRVCTAAAAAAADFVCVDTHGIYLSTRSVEKQGLELLLASWEEKENLKSKIVWAASRKRERESKRQ